MNISEFYYKFEENQANKSSSLSMSDAKDLIAECAKEQLVNYPNVIKVETCDWKYDKTQLEVRVYFPPVDGNENCISKIMSFLSFATVGSELDYNFLAELHNQFDTIDIACRFYEKLGGRVFFTEDYTEDCTKYPNHLVIDIEDCEFNGDLPYMFRIMKNQDYYIELQKNFSGFQLSFPYRELKLEGKVYLVVEKLPEFKAYSISEHKEVTDKGLLAKLSSKFNIVA